MYDILKKSQKNTAKKTNQTGLTDQLKSNVERLSGYSMDDVRVYRNSTKPVQLHALAYTQGTEIHLSPGQERYLPHEAWHVVQQMQGRVRPTVRVEGMAVNDDPALECEADRMGEKVTQMKTGNCLHHKTVNNACIQRMRAYTNEHILNIDASGNITNQGANREDPPVSTLANLLFDGKVIGGHLLKREYGGLDNFTNVVPWSYECEEKYTDFEGRYKNHLKECFKGQTCTFSTKVEYCNILNLDNSKTKRFVNKIYSLQINRNRGNVNQTKLTKPQINTVAEALNHFPKKVFVSVDTEKYNQDGLGSFGFNILSEDFVSNKMRQLGIRQINNIIDSVRRGE